MKKLIALLAVVSYVPLAHAAEGDWTHSGEFRLQYTNNDEADFDSATQDGRGQTIHQRSKLNTTVRAGEKMTFNLGMVHNADWGSNADQTPDDVIGGDAGATAGDPEANDTNNLLTINEAYMTWQASDEMTVKAGRISQTFGDGTVVSANEYLNVQKAFDGGGFIYDLEPVRLAVFGVRGGNDNATANTYGSFYGVSADLKTMPAFLKMVNLHYIMVKRNAGTYEVDGAAVGLSEEDTARIGVTVAGDTAGIDYRATYAMHDGDGSDSLAPGTKVGISATMMDLEVGYSMPAMMNFRVHAGYHMDSGDDDPAAGDNDRYNPFHYQQHENAGLMDVLGWGNLTYTRAGFALSPMEDLTVGAEYLMFTKTEEDGLSYGSDGSTPVAGAAVAGEDDLGTELDVVVTKKYTNNFAIQARYGMFSPGDAFTTDDTFTQMYLEGKMTF